MSRYRGAHVTAMPRHQNPHDPMIGRRPAAAPADFAHEKEQERQDTADREQAQSGVQPR
jgi:hypothetical protein